MVQDCDSMTHLITGLVDQELEGSQLGQVEHHLEKCSLCRERYEAERRLKALVHEHVQPVAAPADLRDRIRRRLDRESRRAPSLLDALRSNFALHPGLSMAMAAVLLLLVVLPSYFAFVRKPFAGGRVLAISKSGHVVDITGEIICIDCAILLRAHAADEATVARLAKEHESGLHHPGLLIGDGQIYDLLRTGKGLDLLLKMPSHEGEHVSIHGVVYPEERLIEVDSYQLI